jgi:hypothetical protein
MARHTYSVEALAPVAKRARDAGAEAVDPADLPALQPRGVGETLDTAFDVLRARFVTLMLLTVSLWIPVKALLRVAFRLDPTAWQAQAGLNLFGATVVQGLAVGLLIFVGKYCCLYVPGLVLSWLWAVAPAALILERVGPVEALGRSVRLVQKSFLRWLGIFAIQSIPAALISIYVGLLDTPEARIGLQEALHMPSLLFDALDTLVVSLLHALATVLAAVVLTVYYLDNRVRNEGFDLHMRFERLRGRHRAGPEPAS